MYRWEGIGIPFASFRTDGDYAALQLIVWENAKPCNFQIKVQAQQSRQYFLVSVIRCF